VALRRGIPENLRLVSRNNELKLHKLLARNRHDRLGLRRLSLQVRRLLLVIRLGTRAPTRVGHLGLGEGAHVVSETRTAERLHIQLLDVARELLLELVGERELDLLKRSAELGGHRGRETLDTLLRDLRLDDRSLHLRRHDDRSALKLHELLLLRLDLLHVRVLVLVVARLELLLPKRDVVLDLLHLIAHLHLDLRLGVLLLLRLLLREKLQKILDVVRVRTRRDVLESLVCVKPVVIGEGLDHCVNCVVDLLGGHLDCDLDTVIL